MTQEPERQRGHEGGDLGSPVAPFISAALFLYVGFLSGLSPLEDAPLFYWTTIGFVWMARIVGVGLLIIGVLVLLRVRQALYLDLVVAGLATLGCVVAGVVWLLYGASTNAVLVLIFAAVNGNAAYATWRVVSSQRVLT